MMENLFRFLFMRERKLGILTSAVTVMLILISVLLVWKAQASDLDSPNQVSNLETINIVFHKSELDLTDENIAADNFANLLSQETGLTIHAYVNRCEADVVELIGTGQADVATMGIYAYVLGNKEYGIQARLVNIRFGRPYFRSQINVPAAKGYTDILDLQNKKFASPNPNSTSGYYVPYMMILNKTGMTPSEFFSEVSFVGDHNQVIRDVYHGVADCGGTFEDARMNVQSEYPDVYDVVSVLAYSENIPNGPWAFHPGLDELLIQKLTNGIIAVASTPQGESDLNTILYSQGVEIVQDSDYDLIRDIVSEFGLEIGSCSFFENYLPITLMNANQ